MADKYMAQGWGNSKNTYLGIFDTIEEASKAYEAWNSKRLMGGNPQIDT